MLASINPGSRPGFLQLLLPQSRVSRRIAQGLLLAMRAPAGWLAIRVSAGHGPLDERREHPNLYLYLTVPTSVAFAFFGAMIGHHERTLEAANRRLEQASVTDELTGLKNLRYFRARLFEEHARSQRSGEPLSVAVLDLDHFKQVNDAHGHLVGDQVLRGAARALQSETRQGDTAARVGGEEFALLLPATDVGEAASLVEPVRRAVAGTYLFAGSSVVHVTISARVACSKGLPASGIDALYWEADRALYRAKQRGRDRVVTASGDHSNANGPSITGPSALPIDFVRPER